MDSDRLDIKENVLEEALRTVEARMDTYGHPYENFAIIQKLWSAILGTEVTFTEIVFCLMALKMGRQLTNENRDNIVDIPGYAWVLEKVLDREEELAKADRHTESE